MKEFKTMQSIVEEKSVVKIVCNKCGIVEEGEYVDRFSSISSFKHTFGYGSNKDGSIFKFELCDTCFDEFVKTFKIAPKVERYL